MAELLSVTFPPDEWEYIGRDMTSYFFFKHRTCGAVLREDEDPTKHICD